MSETPTATTAFQRVVQALSEVSASVGAVRKDQKNTGQGFNFRGIDQVVNAIHPEFTKRGLIVIPEVESIDWDEITNASGKRMAWVKVTVAHTYTLGESDGDGDAAAVISVVAAEATDTADKATAKAMSVALRTSLLQVLSLPTDEPDPDADYQERGTKQKASAATGPDLDKIRTQVMDRAKALEVSPEKLAEVLKTDVPFGDWQIGTLNNAMAALEAKEKANIAEAAKALTEGDGEPKGE